MRALIIVLVLLSLFQTTVLPVNLVLVVLLCRSLVVDEKLNLYLGFFLGLLLGFLQGQTLGLLALLYLVILFVAGLLRRSPVLANWMSILIIGAVILGVDQLLEAGLFKAPFSFKLLLIQVLFILPSYLIIRLWEERFVVKADTKLKLR